MTVAWDDIKTALVEFIESTGVVAVPERVAWEREAHPIVYDDMISLKISGEDSLGYDDVEDVEIAPGIFAPRITGAREFVLSIRYHARTEISAARNALETIRACFFHDRLTQVLDDVGIAFLSTETLQAFDTVAEERQESVAVLDVRFSVVSQYFQPDTDTSIDKLAAVDVTVQGRPLSIPE